jgi:hypothetical protein
MVGLGASCTGTKFQKHTCEGTKEEQYQQEVADLQAWRRQVDDRTREWKNKAIARVSALRADGISEGDRSWNLRAVLLRAGQAMQADGRPDRCIVLLGGLAVQTPPSELPIAVLRDAKLVIGGWQGTQRVQDAWRAALSPSGVDPVFLPGTLTDLHLVAAVRSCLGR